MQLAGIEKMQFSIYTTAVLLKSVDIGWHAVKQMLTCIVTLGITLIYYSLLHACILSYIGYHAGTKYIIAHLHVLTSGFMHGIALQSGDLQLIICLGSTLLYSIANLDSKFEGMVG